MIALADCNNFYVSCERVFNPKIRNKAVVVLSNNDGCVIARSNEAKDIGIKMGIPAFKNQHIFKKYDVKIFSTNFVLYSDFSNRVMSILSGSVPQIEIYSIDEAFMDYSGLNNPDGHAQNLCNRIKKWTGIPVSIGIATTKTLAKVANRIAKREVKKDIFYLHCPYDIQYYLKKLPISDLWGIGSSYSKKMQFNGIKTAYELMQCSDKWIRKNMSIVGLKMVNELRGIPCSQINTSWKRKKSICTSRTFGKEIADFNQLAQAISTYAAACGFKLRKQGSCASEITIFILTDPFKKKNGSIYKGVKTINLETPTNDSIDLINKAILSLRSIYRSNCIYKKGGVIVSKIIPQSQVPLSIFDDVLDIKKRYNLMCAIDKVNYDHGNMKVHFVINGFNIKWKIKQKHLSKCYTTRINELMQVYT